MKYFVVFITYCLHNLDSFQTYIAFIVREKNMLRKIRQEECRGIIILCNNIILCKESTNRKKNADN